VKRPLLINNKLYNLFYSFKFILFTKTKFNILKETEYKLGFILSLISSVIFLLVSLLGAIFASNFLKLNKEETLLIMFFSYLYWDLSSLFILNLLFRNYWIIATFPLNEKIIAFNGFSLKRVFYIIIEYFFIIFLLDKFFKLNFELLLKTFLFSILLSIIFAFTLNNMYLLSTIFAKTDSYLLSNIVGTFQFYFSKYNPKYIKEIWFKIILFVFLVPFYTYFIIDALKGSFFKYLLIVILILLLELIFYFLLFEKFKKVYEAYGG
jgi:hypothetical protein